MEEKNINTTTQAPEQDLNEILRIRREKLQALKDAGKNPYEIVRYDRTSYSEDIKSNYEEMEGKEGRMVGGRKKKRKERKLK